MAGEKSHALHSDDEAVRQLTLGLELSTRLQPEERRGWAFLLHWRRGWANAGAFRAEAARADFREAERLARALHEDRASASARAALAHCFARLERPLGDAFSAQRYPQVQREDRALGALALAFEALLGRFHVARIMREVAAMRELEPAIFELATALGTPTKRADALACRALTEAFDAHSSESLAASRQAIALARRHHNDRALKAALTSRVGVHLTLGAYEQAERDARDACALASEAFHEQVCQEFSCLARGRLGHVGDAAESYARACLLAERKGIRPDPTRIGWLYRELLPCICRAALLELRTELLWRAGEREQAEASAQRWLALARAHGAREHEALAQGWLGRIAEAAGDFERARAHLEAGLALVQRSPMPFVARSLLTDLARVEERRGREGAAAVARRRAAAVVRRIAASIPEAALRERFLARSLGPSRRAALKSDRRRGSHARRRRADAAPAAPTHAGSRAAAHARSR